MKVHPTYAKQASFTLYRKRNASALAACGGYVGALLFLWVARQWGTQVPSDVLGVVVLAIFGAALLLMSTTLLTMAALDTPIAIFTPDGVLVGGIRLLFGHRRIVLWSAITSLDTMRLRDRTVLLIQLHQPHSSSDQQRASLLWAISRSLNRDTRFSERFMAAPVSEVVAELRRRFAKELHDNRIRIKDM